MSAIADALPDCDGDSQRSHILRSAAFAEQGQGPSVVTEVALGRGPKPGSRSLRGRDLPIRGPRVADNIRPGRQALFWTAVAGGLCRPIGLPCIVADAFIRRAPAMRRQGFALEANLQWKGDGEGRREMTCLTAPVCRG